MESRVEIVNIVATLKLEPMPNPEEILEKIPGSRPLKRFKGAMIRIGRTPVLFYRNRIVVTGVKTREELESLIEELLSTLRKHGFVVEHRGYEIVNVTAKLELGHRINLAEVADKLSGLYDPDYRPYAIARVDGATVIASEHGKVVLLGSSGLEQAKSTLNKVLYLILPGSQK